MATFAERIKGFFGLANKPVKAPTKYEEQKMEKEKQSYSVEKYFRGDIGVQDWRDAVNQCFLEPYYNHVPLYSIYENTYLDDNVFAQVQTRFNGTMAEPFAFYDKSSDKKNEKLTELFQKTWFKQLMRSILDSRLWGYKVVQFFYDDFFKNNQFTQIFSPEPVYINPRERLFLPNPYSNIEYRIPLDNFSLILEFGGSGSMDNLGLLLRPSRRVIYKDFTFSDWARFNEMFGVPFRFIKTSSTNENTIAKHMKTLDNFGVNGYAVLGDSDDINVLGDNGTGNVDNFLKLIEQCDLQASKGLIGQTATSDQKSFVGSAEVQERKLDWWVEEDMYYVQDCVNEKVLPFLSQLGRAYQGIDQYKFEFEFFHDKKNKKETTPVQPDQKEDQNGNLSLESDCCDDDYPFGKA